MTEKNVAIEIHPMRGHSRADWWGTLDDIVDSEEEAEYWALFGVTHRGNKHCLGEFPTKSDAIVARQGVSIFGKERMTKAKRRKVIQIEIVEIASTPPQYNFSHCAMMALFGADVLVAGTIRAQKKSVGIESL